MEEKEELELEAKLIHKMWERLRRIRAAGDVKFPLSTYDTNVILQEVGSEIRQARIVEERKMRDLTFVPSAPQMKWINDMRSQANEPEAKPVDFKTNDLVDKEISRLKKLLRSRGVT